MTELKRTIIQGATELFAKKGCKAVTMDDIAKSLGMSKRTIYENFKDKEELLSCCLDLLFEEVDEIMVEFEKSENIIRSFLEFKDSATSVLHRIPKDFFLDVKRYYPNVYAKSVETRIGEDHAKTLFFLEKGKKEGYFLKSLNAKFITVLMQGVGQVMCNKESFSPKHFSKEDIFKNGFVLFLRGISTTKGIETIDKYYNLQ